MIPSSQAEWELWPGVPVCPWLVSHCVPGVDTEKGALHITLPGILLRTCVAIIIYLDVMQSHPFLYCCLCRVLMFGLFFLPPIIPEI